MTKKEMKRNAENYLATKEDFTAIEEALEIEGAYGFEIVSRRGYLALEFETDKYLFTLRIATALPSMLVFDGLSMVDKANAFVSVAIAF